MMKLDITSKMPVSSCVECGHEMNAATGDTQPQSGDYTVCINCGCLNIFTTDLTLRAPDTDEVFTANKDKRISTLQSAIKQLKGQP